MVSSSSACTSSVLVVLDLISVRSAPGHTLSPTLLNMTNRPGNPQDKEMWIGDSGATVHITNDDTGMFNIKKCDFDVTVGNQETTKCAKMGDINLKLKN